MSFYQIITQGFTNFSEQSSQYVAELIPKFILATLVCAVGYVIYFSGKLAINKIALAIGLEEDSKKLILRLARAVMLLVIITTVLGIFGVNVAAMVTGMGLTGIMITMALKDAASNVLSGLLVRFYKPFEKGEVIELAANPPKGKVLKIGLRYTVIRYYCEEDKTYKTAYVPNQLMSNKTILLDADVKDTSTHAGIRMQMKQENSKK